MMARPGFMLLVVVIIICTSEVTQLVLSTLSVVPKLLQRIRQVIMIRSLLIWLLPTGGLLRLLQTTTMTLPELRLSHMDLVSMKPVAIMPTCR